MGKRRPDTNQLGFAFDAPAMPSPAQLAGDSVRVSALVAEILHGDPRPRQIIAAEMSVMLGEDVSKHMLDAYASPGRGEHSISYSRFKALVAVTARYDLFDRDIRPIGVALLVGEEIMAARVGHLRAQKKQIDEALREAERACSPISRAGGQL